MTTIYSARRLIIPAGLALCLGLVTACNCTKSRVQTTSNGTSQRLPSQTELTNTLTTVAEGAVIPLHKETFVVSKKNVDAKQVHLRKVVITVKTNLPVEFRKEVLEIVQEPAGAGTATNDVLSIPDGKEVVIQLWEERPEVQKHVVQTENVVIKKQTQEEQRTLFGEVRREDVQVDRTGKASVSFKGGQINEAAGAQPKGEPQATQP